VDVMTPDMPGADAPESAEDRAAREQREKYLRELHSVAIQRWKLAEDFERTDRQLAAEDLKFAAGGEGQWPAGMAAERERDGRPMLTINRLAASIKQVINDARQNKPGIKVIPAGSEDAEAEKRAKQKAEIYEGIVRQIESTSRAQQIYMPAYELVVRGGFRGSWRVTTRYCDDETFDQEIVLEPILSPFAVYRDPDSKSVDHADDQWCFVCEDVSIKKFQTMYPDEAQSSWDGGHEGLALDGWKTIDTVRLAEYWFFEDGDEKIISVLDTGEVVEGEAEAFQYPMEHEKYPGHVARVERTRKVRQKRVMRVIMNGMKVLEGPHAFPGKIIPIVSVEGPRQWVGDQMRHWSLIREAKGPQQAYNFWQSAIAEKIALAPKQPFIVTANQIKGYEEMWATANKSTASALVYNADPAAPGPPARQQPAAVSQAEMTQAAQAIDDIKATMGIFDRSLGNSSQEKSGRAILAVQAQGDNATFDFPDLFATAIAHCGRIIVGLIPEVYRNRRTIRALLEDGATRSYTVNDGTPDMDIVEGKYDVQVVVGPSYATKRMEAAEKVIALAQAVPQVGMVGADLIVRAQDMPHAEELADRLKKTLPPGVAKPSDGEEPPEPPGPDPRMMIEMRTAKADIELKEAQREKVDAERDGVKLQNQMLAAQIAPDLAGIVQQLVRQTIAEMLQGEQEEPQEEQQEMPEQQPMTQPQGMEEPQGMPPGM
jgi:hypothetical protein